ncbi:uncharacterized protein DUF929 [Kribbella steppae]|uniref:Uncharacterized protein DUF929 n=1 Tax=Kribbella steppae TaxID=2512223 RepID=A0A4R2I046_9ACTN|nr:DUF929 family protein [Kribbella steppae]TCO35735.1 uncharacterized protein DUF929 [Kribbella steppae]
MSRRVEQKAQARQTKVAELRAAQRRAERRKRLLIAFGAVAAVVIVVVGLVVVRLAGGGQQAAAGPSGSADAQIVSALAAVPSTTFDEVGTAGVQGGPAAINASALTADGKPKVLYIGAEFCPFCAAERWPVAVALSRFGAFGNLGTTHSAGDDVYPNTPTLSFHGATYTSQYLAFTGVETTTNEKVGDQYAPLDTPSAADQQTFETYNQPPYVKSGGSIPFIDIGGKYVSSGATYSPEILAGKTQAEIANALKDPSSPIARAVDASANLYTAALCQVTGNQPGNVCTSAAVTAAAGKLGKS